MTGGLPAIPPPAPQTRRCSDVGKWDKRVRTPLPCHLNLLTKILMILEACVFLGHVDCFEGCVTHTDTYTQSQYSGWSVQRTERHQSPGVGKGRLGSLLEQACCHG